MTPLFDKHRLIVSPGLAPTQLRETEEFALPQKADALLTIGLINNMPDSALQATERQFMDLLRAAAGGNRIHFHCFSLPSISRSAHISIVSPRFPTMWACKSLTTLANTSAGFRFFVDGACSE